MTPETRNEVWFTKGKESKTLHTLMLNTGHKGENHATDMAALLSKVITHKTIPFPSEHQEVEQVQEREEVSPESPTTPTGCGGT